MLNRHGTGSRWRATASWLGCVLLASTSPLSAQDADEAARAARVERADSVRAAMRDARPPGDHPTDWVDVVSVPFKIIGAPLDLVLVRLPAFVVTQLTAPRPPGFLLRLYRDLSEAGVHPAAHTSIGPRSGPAVGLVLDAIDPLRWESALSLHGSQRHRLRARFGDAATAVEVAAAWSRDAQAPFYGIGARTPNSRVLYRLERAAVDASASYELTRTVGLEVGVGYEDDLVSEPLWVDDEPSLLDSPGATELFGAQGRQSYLRFGAGGSLDFTRREGFQSQGVRLSTRATVFRGVDGTPSNFHELRFEAHGLIPMNDRQLLALCGLTEIARGGSGEIPFYHLPALGGEHSAIGYPDNRFLGADMISLSAEWRYEIWRDIHNSLRLESFLHVGEGAVGHRLDELEPRDWRASYGFGFRLARPTGLVGVGYVGFSDESFHVGIGAEWEP